MKKNPTYRDRLIELSKIYKINEVKNYIKSKKQLTVPQLELILKKNRVPVPKEINKNIWEIQVKKILKPVSNVSFKLNEGITSLKSHKIKSYKLFIRNIESFFKYILSGFFGALSSLSRTTLNILNNFYNFRVEEKKFNKVFTPLAVFTVFAVIFTTGITIYKLNENQFFLEKPVKVDKEPNKFLVKKQDVQKKIELKTKNNTVKQKIEDSSKLKSKKQDIKTVVKPKKPVEKKPSEVTELILPNLNLKTSTVLSLFEDVKYDLKKVRFEKKVKPIYFTQFPKDLDEIQSIQLKKETFIKIVLPLVVAENGKILDDRFKLDRILSRKMTNDKEKSWLKQKLREYKVKNGNMEELQKRMDIIPVSIALSQAAKESGWGTSRFALEGNAIFGQWTWDGKGIAPLSREEGKSHKILRFPILRASVKAYKNNLNTHKGYKKFREKRLTLRKKRNPIQGLDLINTLDSYAQTGEEYTDILKKIILQNSLEDFETVELTNSVKRRELNL